jgi:hypothetical protein
MQRLSDVERSRIETERRMVLRTLHASSTIGTNEELVFRALQAQRYPTVRHEIRVYLDYLEQKGLARIEDRDADLWHAFITADGIDVIEGAIKTPPGIAKG